MLDSERRSLICADFAKLPSSGKGPIYPLWVVAVSQLASGVLQDPQCKLPSSQFDICHPRTLRYSPLSKLGKNYICCNPAAQRSSTRITYKILRRTVYQRIGVILQPFHVFRAPHADLLSDIQRPIDLLSSTLPHIYTCP